MPSVFLGPFMWFGVANPGLLLGLLALAIPLLIHFFQRRRYEVVDWGAMQFLHAAPSVRRRWRWDDALLLLLRLAILAVLVLALAGLFVQVRAARHYVLILDPSASMGRGNNHEKARAWVETFLDRLKTGDRVTLIRAGQPPEVSLPSGTSELDLVRAFLNDLPPPAGGADFPGALRLAREILGTQGGQILVLRDDQKGGWADPTTLAQWESLAPAWKTPDAPRRSLVTFAGPGNGFNLWLGPVLVPRAVVAPGQPFTASATLHWKGTGAPAEVLVRARVNGEEMERWRLPLAGTSSPLPLSVPLKLTRPGQHLITLEAANPKGDVLPEDDRQHVVVEVAQELPVLLVDGDEKLSPSGTTFFLENVLREEGKIAPLFVPVVVSVKELSPKLLAGKKGTSFRAVILADVPRLTEEQAVALDRFAFEGGGILVALGPRSVRARDHYNDLHAEGRGWFPVRLEGQEGQEGKLEQAVEVSLSSLAHPALEYFRDPTRLLNRARFPAWVNMDAGEKARVAATLNSGQPFLVETAWGKGRVLVCSVPLDASWGGNFPKVEAYPVLIHQLLFYLAEAGGPSWRVFPGQRGQWSPPVSERWEGSINVFWTGPNGAVSPMALTAGPWLSPPLRQAGPYSLTWGPGKKSWFVVPPDPREADPTSLTQEETTLRGLLPFEIVSEPDPSVLNGSGEGKANLEIWWLLFLAVVGLLCLEIAHTRRMALRQP